MLTPRPAPLIALLLLLCLLLAPSSLLAHRVNIFAWVERGGIEAECRFSTGSPARASLVELFDLASGERLAETRTDEEGRAFLPLDGRLRGASGLRLVLWAGDGHRGETSLAGEELDSGLSPSPSGPSGRAAGAVQPDQAGKPGQSDKPAQAGASGPAASRASQSGTPESRAQAAGLSAEEMEGLVDRVLERKLAPLRRSLAELAQPGPSMRDVVGGMGWLLGLFGLAAWLRRR